MVENKLLRYLIISMIVMSATFYYGAYTAGVIAFLIIFIRNPKHLIKLAAKEKAIILFIAALIMATLFSKVQNYSLLIDGIILMHLMIYLVIISSVDKENIENIMKMLNLVGIMVGVYGIYQYLTGDLTIDRSWTDTSIYGSLQRIYSTMRNPNMLAGYLTFNISFSIAFYLKDKNDRYTAINIMLSSICLILTYSRGGFIAFAIAMLIIAIICREIKVGAYLAIMVFIFYSYNFTESSNRTDLTTLATDSSSLYRIEIWKASWGLFKENIAFGSGPGSIAKLLSYSSYKLKGYIVHSHNIPLHILAETGLLGATAFIALIITWIKSFFSFWVKHKDSEYSYIAVGFAASSMSMLIHGMVDSVVLVPSRSLIFLIYLALFPAIYLKVYNKQSL